jgi:hypothetical protein
MNIHYKALPGSFYSIKGSHFKLNAQVLLSVIDQKPCEGLEFSKPKKHKGKICNISGTVFEDVSTYKNLKLVREVFISNKKDKAGIRLLLTNTGKEPVRLRSLTPLSVNNDKSISVSNANYGKWAVMRMARHKNDTPGCFKPGIEDNDLKDVSLRSAEIPAGYGVSKEDLQKFSKTSAPIISEPGIFIKNRNKLSQPGLFISALGQDKHLSLVELSHRPDKKDKLGKLDVVCEFDGIRIDEGETIETHWIMVYEANEENKMYADFAELLGELYNCPAPQLPPPSLYCSWYFYGDSFSEADLDENLKVLKKNPIPFDVFLIDSCWQDNWGSWQANEQFPSGMKSAADKIKAAGFKPGIWTCPFMVSPKSSILKKYPDLFARDKNGDPAPFSYGYPVDPTSPHAQEYFNELFGRLREWGFLVHKFDFLRALMVSSDIRFYNPKVTRAQAYRLGMSMIKKALGPDGYILACGGLFEGSIGLADAIRVGSDVKGFWRENSGTPEFSYMRTIKQIVFRSYFNRFFHTDPDAAMLRLRDETFNNNKSDTGPLSLGSFTEEEAFTIVANQYIGGGMMCFSERLAELQPERKAMLRHIIPARFPVPKVLDMWSKACPSLILSEVTPSCKSLGKWWTLAVSNWKSKETKRKIYINELPAISASNNFAVFEFRTQNFLGVFDKNKCISVAIPSRATRLLRIVPWNGKDPVILGTDLHLTGGGVELKEIKIRKNEISGKVETKWDYPISITAGFPYQGKLKAVNLKLEPKTINFQIQYPSDRRKGI